MDYQLLTAPCGKDCFNCPLCIAEENRENREAFFKSNNMPSVNDILAINKNFVNCSKRCQSNLTGTA